MVKTSSVGGPRSSFKAHPKPNLHQKKVKVTVWQSAASMIHYSFLNSGETITSEKYTQQIGEVHWQLPPVINRKGPTLLRNSTQLHGTKPTLQKLNELTYEVLPLAPYSPDLLPTNYHSSCISTVFCKENASTTRRRQKMFSKSSSNPEAWIFTGMNKLISHWQKCADCNGFYFDE